MKIGYARVSTRDQNLDMQIEALTKAGCEKIFSEKKSGKDDNRMQLQECINYLRSGDTLVVYNLSRLSRLLKKMLQVICELEEKGMFAPSNGGYIYLKKLYSTIGLIGYFEAAQFLNINPSNNDEYFEFLKYFLGLFRSYFSFFLNNNPLLLHNLVEYKIKV